MLVVPVEDRKADPDQRHTGVTLQVLAVGVADQEIGLFCEQQRTHVPQVLARIGLASRTEGRAVEQFLHLARPGLAAIGRKNHHRLTAQLHHELGETIGKVGIAIDGELLAVDMGVGVGDGVHQTATLLGEFVGDFHTGHARHFHHEAVSRLNADWVVERGHFLAVRGDEGKRLLGAVFLHRDGALGMDGIGRIFQRGAAIIHAKLAVGGRIPHVRLIAQQRVFDLHHVEDALYFAQVAHRIAIKAIEEVDLPVGHPLQLGRGLGLAVPEVLQDALHGIVVAGDVAADEGRGVRERNVEFGRKRFLFLRSLDEGVEVIADHFGHARGRNRDHLGLVHRIGIGQPVDHVGQPAEHRRVLGHRGGNARGRLLEVAREVRTIVGNAALRAVHEGQRAFKANRGEHRAQGLAGLGRVDRQRLAAEVEVLVFLGLGPFLDPFDLGIGMGIFEFGALLGEHVLVFVAAKQLEVVFDLICVLGHVSLLSKMGERAGYSAAIAR